MGHNGCLMFCQITADEERRVYVDIQECMDVWMCVCVYFFFNLLLTSMFHYRTAILQGGSNMTGTDLYVNKPHCAAAVRP